MGQTDRWRDRQKDKSKHCYHRQGHDIISGTHVPATSLAVRIQCPSFRPLAFGSRWKRSYASLPKSPAMVNKDEASE